MPARKLQAAVLALVTGGNRGVGSRCIANSRADDSAGIGAGVLVNCVNRVWVRTRMDGRGAPQSVAQGADTIAGAARLPDSGPTGRFFSDRREIDW